MGNYCNISNNIIYPFNILYYSQSGVWLKMITQISTISTFCNNAKYYLVKFPYDKGDFGKILKQEELIKVDLKNNEIYRSIEEKDGNTLFAYSLRPKEAEELVDNPLQLLINNLEEARRIERVYPGIFKWVFDGICIKAYTIVPSGDSIANSTITRFGGTEMFMKILRQHLDNIRKLGIGNTPNYDFLHNKDKIEEIELSIGSINLFNKLYCISINLVMNYIEVIKKSRDNIQFNVPLTILNMKYWAKEVNPDFLMESKHITLKTPLAIDMEFKLYPEVIKRLMTLKYKGNYNRFLLARFLLSAHNPRDAKFIYDSVMGDEEKRHIESGNCKQQWNSFLNNFKRYGCPTMRELQEFIRPGDEKVEHPLQRIQEILIKKIGMVN